MNLRKTDKGTRHTSRSTAAFKDEINGAAAVDVYKVDTARTLFCEDFRRRDEGSRFVSGNLDSKYGFRGMPPD